MELDLDITGAFVEDLNILSSYDGGFVNGSVTDNAIIGAGDDKDDVIQKLIPDEVGECLIASKGHCMSTNALSKVAEVVGATDEKPEHVIEKAKTETGCGTELCILESLKPQLGPQLVHSELQTNFKIEGPTDNGLLSNYNIDEILQQFTVKFPGFFAYNFNMANFTEYRFDNGKIIKEPDTLHTMPFVNLYGKYNCAGCVVNTDVYQGKGKHWMALFIDARNGSVGSGASVDGDSVSGGAKCTVEFFNSSGGSKPEWVAWLIKTRDEMSSHMPTEIVRCDRIRHQKSMSECGLYSLFYIYARLQGVPYEYFQNAKVQDRHMFEFRQHLFNNGKGISDGKFSWDEYKKQVNIKWEK